MKQKIKYILSCVILFIILIVLIIMLILTKIDINFDSHVLNGYYDNNKVYIDSGIDFTAFYEYYYKKEYDYKYSKQKDYKIINDSNIDYIKRYFEDYSKKVDFSFSIPNISNGDYYYLKNENKDSVKDFYTYSLYLYSIKDHKLIYIHY